LIHCRKFTLPTMSFTIRHTTKNNLDLISIRDESNGTEISVVPAFGAMLHSFSIRGRDGSDVNVIDSYADLAELKAETGRWFRSAKLSPFPCRIPDGKYRFGDKEYRFRHLFSDGNAIHGLLYDKPFDVLEETGGETSGTIVLEYSYKKDDEGYPFDYDCQVRYILHPDNVLEVVTAVTNLDRTTIPIADGWHPYFQLGGKANGWEMQFHSDAMVEFNDRLIPTGRLVQYNDFGTVRPIGDTSLDNCFTLKPDLVSAACEIHNPVNGLTISFFPDANYPYLQLYTPNDRDSIAVENLSGAPDCFNNKMGLILLQPGRSQIFTVRYKVGVR
jgi:aldose 1-epimerase